MMEEKADAVGKAVDEAEEESHEALWTSMSTVIVSDKTCAPVKRCTVEDSSDSECESSSSGSARPAQHGTTRERLNPDRASDSDGSTSDSGGSEPCRVVDVEEESVNAKDGVTLADLLGACPDMAQQQSIAVADSESRQGADENGAHLEDGAQLPSVKRAQKQLKEIMSRRSMISAISSKYSPALAVGFSKERVAATPPGPAQYPPAAPPMPKGGEIGSSHGKVDVDSLGPPKDHVALPSIPERMKAAEGAAAPGNGVGRAMPVRMSGPSARPDRAQVSDVLRQLGAGLNGLGARPGRADGPGQGVEVSEVAPPLDVCGMSRASEPTPLQAEHATSPTGTDQAHSSRGATPSSDNFIGIVDGNGKGLSGAKVAWPADGAANSIGSRGPGAPSTSGAAVPSAASRYLVCEGGVGAGSEGEAGRNAWPIEAKKLQEGRKREESRREELWLQFLAGSDHPVGSDLLPSPESYHGGVPP